MGGMGQDLSDPLFRESIRLGSRDAWAVLHHRCSRWLLAKARWLVECDADADDAAAETWRRAWKGVGRYDPRWSPTTWLAQILTRVCVDLARATRLRHGFALREEAAGMDAMPDDDRSKWREALRRAIAELPDRQRVVIRLHLFAHLPAAEIARLLRGHPTDVHHCLARAIKNLGPRLRREFPRR